MFSGIHSQNQPMYKRSTSAHRGVAAFAAIVISSSLLGGLLSLFEAQSAGAIAKTAVAARQPAARVAAASQPSDASLPKASDVLGVGLHHAGADIVSTF